MAVELFDTPNVSPVLRAFFVCLFLRLAHCLHHEALRGRAQPESPQYGRRMEKVVILRFTPRTSHLLIDHLWIGN